MPSLIDELRLANRANRDRDILDLDATAEGQRIYDEFAKRTGRFGRVCEPGKQRQESDALLDFLLATDLPAEHIALGDEPDAMIRLGSRTVGIEIARAVVPHPLDRGRSRHLKEQEVLQDQIVQLAMGLEIVTSDISAFRLLQRHRPRRELPRDALRPKAYVAGSRIHQ